jgi:hypothetical protein
MTRDEYIHEWCYFRCGIRWEARRAWEYVSIHGDPFGFFNLPSRQIPKCSVRCRRCKTALDIDFAHIKDSEVYDYDCENCFACNCFSSVSLIKKLDRFKRRCQAYEQAWQTIVYGDELDDACDSEESVTVHKRRGISSSLRWRVLRRDSFRCRYCGANSDETQLHVDHVMSRADGGSDAIGNLATACAECNLGKGSDSLMRPSDPRHLPAIEF